MTKKDIDKKSFWDDDVDEVIKDEDKEVSINYDLIKPLYLEFEILNNFNHPNIVKVYGSYYGDKNHNPVILLEYCKTDLEKVIN